MVEHLLLWCTLWVPNLVAYLADTGMAEGSGRVGQRRAATHVAHTRPKAAEPAQKGTEGGEAGPTDNL